MNHQPAQFLPLDEAQRDSFFIRNLNQMYWAKSHLYERLPELCVSDGIDLQQAIGDTLDDLDRQILRMDKLFAVLEVQPDLTSCEGLITLFQAAFDAVLRVQLESQQRDLAILFYLATIEGIELASFKLLQLAVPRQNAEAVQQLLKENADDGQDDLPLRQYIARHYFS